MTTSIDDILAGDDTEFVRVVTARIPRVPQALRDEHRALDARLTELNAKRDGVDIPAEQIATAERLAAIEAEFEANMVEFRFGCIGYRAWADLLKAHPPTKQQLAEDRNLDHNPEEFPYEAMAASCLEPKMTADQVREVEGRRWVDAAAWRELWGACLRANVADAAPKSLAAGLILRRNGASATTAASTASPVPSSSAG